MFSPLFSALQCRLHCDPGYVSHRAPVVTCAEGRYTPAKPSSFVCQPAAALVFSHTGEVEVLSKKCSMALAHSHDFSGRGRTASLLDKQIILIGNDTLSGSEGNFISIQNPRDGLLAMKYTKETFPTRGSPFQHTALSLENQLNLLGGRYKSRTRFEHSTWMDINLKWEESQKAFVPKFFAACSVQNDTDSFYVFGGAETLHNKSTSVRDQILHINTTSLMVKLVGTMKKPRMAFGCEFLNKSFILLSGGYSDPVNSLQSIAPDEIFSIAPSVVSFDGTESVFLPYLLAPEALSLEDDSLDDGTGSFLLPMTDSLQRFQHSLIRMDEVVFAFGGLDKDNSTSAKIKLFNEATKSWENHDQNLTSKNSEELLVVPFPTSSLDCAFECQCGRSNSMGSTRIFNGSNTQVNTHYP